MTDVGPGVESPSAPRRYRLDQWLNVGLWILAVVFVFGVAYFGYTVYLDRQSQNGSSAAERIAISLESQVRKSPNDAILRVRLGEALGAEAKYPQAIEQLNAALKIDPQHSGALYDLGTIAMMTKKYSEAEAYFTKVVSVTEASQYANIDPLREQALYNLGLLALNDNNYSQAAGYFKASIALRNDASDTYYQLAHALNGLGDTDGAIQQLEMALQFDPNYPDVYYFMGQLYQKKHDDVNASYDFAKAASLAPTAPQPKQALAAFGTAASWVSKAQTAKAAGDIETALTDVLVARNLDAKSVVAAELHGDILVQRGDPKDALDVYRQALALDPKNAEIQGKIAQVTPAAKAAAAAAAAKAAKSKKKK